MSTVPLRVPRAVVTATLVSLQDGGRRRSESVALWLGRREPGVVKVIESYVPEHTAAEDYFEIPQTSIAALFARMRASQAMVAAQIHTHPGRAFHSVADDRWAIVRHIGAISIVLPDFALRTSTESFVHDAAVFVLDERNVWQLSDHAPARLIRVVR
jgi:hypothetical protein